MLNGYTPIFSQFGDNIYASDVVQNCIDVIATEISKLQPRHIRVDSSGMQTSPKGSLNRLFEFAPNELMTTREFLEKVVWLLFLNYNVFIYPTYEFVKQNNGSETRNYTGFYPLNPYQVDFVQDSSNKLFVKMYFRSGESFTLPYSDVIHIRKKFSVNEVMGGGMNGQPDNVALLKVLQINDSVLQGLEKGIKTSLSIRGILKISTLLDDGAQRLERERFEKLMKSGESGILPMDLKGEYTPLNLDPKFVDKDTLAFLKSSVQEWYGVSLAILSRDYTDEQYQAFYESTLEPLVIGLGQVFSKTLFTPRELDVGNKIVFYHKDMMYLSTSAKLNLLKTAGEQGLLTDNQKLALLGYPPIEGGDKRTMSLNYIDVNLANAYQMGRTNTTNGGKGDEPAK
ncbi:phage portal protein [Paenibacillus radicis (ex Xue et al. 2023)]|uniref:Phage portal protein n=1 Tax=Paenibacillus radicis (ex Xue et al. 2023) TaxID=2972489 RepID=A0ABT1YRF6_9BACL|nr:phage portal protein [Paenibacillus radicis (ex Xue et al. 2023)]MCR8635755.1 phage portal protein [Paenibacillus radicis (ex Xue et al. 2023)]